MSTPLYFYIPMYLFRYETRFTNRSNNGTIEAIKLMWKRRWCYVDLEKRLEVRFYRQESGNEPVRDWLRSLGQEERRLIGEDIKTVQFGWPVGMPVVRQLGKGLYEIRTNLDGKISRVFFCLHAGEIILLHGIIKKSQKIPKNELETAKKRMSKVV